MDIILNMCVCRYVCVYTYGMYVYVCVYIYIHTICIHTYTYTHIPILIWFSLVGPVIKALGLFWFISCSWTCRQWQSCRWNQTWALRTNQVMSELSTVLDLRLLGKMWRGTSGEQTPQPVRMTLGNKGAVHPPSLPPPLHWSFLVGLSSRALV